MGPGKGGGAAIIVDVVRIVVVVAGCCGAGATLEEEIPRALVASLYTSVPLTPPARRAAPTTTPMSTGRLSVTASGTATAASPPAPLLPPPDAPVVGGVAVRRRTAEGAGQLPRPWAAHVACTTAPMSASTVEAFAKAETRAVTTDDAEDGDG
jgi:hypothetical protein